MGALGKCAERVARVGAPRSRGILTPAIYDQLTGLGCLGAPVNWATKIHSLWVIRTRTAFAAHLQYCPSRHHKHRENDHKFYRLVESLRHNSTAQMPKAKPRW
jgi:hypothetical protein